MIFIGNTPLSKMPDADPPEELREAFDVAKKAKELDHVKLHYILAIVAKSYSPALAEVGELGCAEYDTNTCYVVESERGGKETTKKVALHELRHFYDGPHPWLEEKGIRDDG